MRRSKRYERRAERFLSELVWYAEALKHQRDTCPDPMHPCGDRALEEVEAGAQARAP